MQYSVVEDTNVSEERIASSFRQWTQKNPQDHNMKHIVTCLSD
jgi:hypothetical protein